MIRRLAPPDRRAPTRVSLGACPQGQSCGCCPGRGGSGHNGRQGCPLVHPAEDRDCQLPFPGMVAACPERQDPAWPQATPAGQPPAGAACVECCRVTARRWVDPEGRRLPWCAGDLEPME